MLHRSQFSFYSFIFLFLFGAFACTVSAQPKVADKVIAVVDNNAILQSDIDLQLIQMASQGTASVPHDAHCLLLNQMMIQKLMIAQANKDSLEVSSEEVETELDKRIAYFIQQVGSKEKFEEYYKKSVVKFKSEFRDPVRDQLLAQKMQQKILADNKVSPIEVREYFATIPADSLPLIGTEIECGQIVMLPKVTPEMKRAAKEKLMGIRKKIEDGATFENQAILYSDDQGTASQGGDLGSFGRGEMVPEFEAAVFKLKDGEISDIIETKYGYHIIKLINRLGDKAHAKHILISVKTTKDGLAVAQRRLDSVRTLIVKDSISFKTAADKFSDDDETKGNGGMFVNPQTGGSLMESSQLDPDMFFILDSMHLGAISKPMNFKTREGKDAVRILFLKNKTSPHRANLKDDYAKIQAAALSDKQETTLHNWIKNHIDRNYIMIDPEYKNCEAVKEIWTKSGQ